VRVSARADYAVRALAELAASNGESMTAESIARAQGVPLKFLLGILGELRRGGLVRSQRGPAGGYLLDRDPSSITIADVMRAVDGPLASVQDAKPEDVSYPGPAAKLQDVWIAVRASLRLVLEQVTIAHLLAGELPESVQELIRSEDAWARR
jgi:Rrf2 family protein